MMSMKLKVRDRARKRCAARKMTSAARLAMAGAAARSALELVPSTLSPDL
jgi:hypothetical protein